MKNKYIRFLVSLGALSVIGIVVVQVFWLRKAFDLREKQFNYNVTLALDNTVQALCEYNQTDIPTQNPIEQVSGNYYVVRTNNVIPPQTLESLLRSEFRKRVIETDFEYTIYDCSNQRVVYKDYVNINSNEPSIARRKTPEFRENEYYFGVFFPNKTASIVNQMGVWVFSSSVLLVVVIFFTVALIVIFRQKRMSEIHRDFVNNMAHEFNTPISSIGLAAGYFRQQKEMAQISKSDRYLSIIENENQKLKKQVDEILQLGRYEQQHYELEVVKCPVEAIIDEAYHEVKTSYPDTTLTYHIETNSETMVSADPGHLRSVFYNLFENTIKYCPSDQIVTISVEEKSRTVTISFSDNGKGIAPKYQKRIFNRFFRVPAGDTQQVKGFGIGLFYIRFILRKMGGKISLVKSDATGTSFTIQLRK
ncbi:MAG: HAMP domain-containing sensor histidine kinase [Cyclobacteriaceae bacterium]